MAVGEDLPGPLATWDTFWRLVSNPFYDNGPNDKGIGLQLWASLQRVFIGFAAGSAVAIPLGIVIGSSRIAQRLIDPIVQVLKPVSPLAWFPIGLVALPSAPHAAIFAIFITALWPTVINTAFGVSSIPQAHKDVARVFEFSRWRYLTKIVLPYSLPHIIVGLRLSMGIAWLVIVAAEMLSGGTGIGFYVWDSWNALNIEQILSAILIIGIVGLRSGPRIRVHRRPVRLRGGVVMAAPYLEISNVTKSFGDFTALGGVDLNIERGEFVSLIGHSGCGKSTLLSLIAGLTKPTAGKLILEGEAITGPGADRGMVFQQHSLLPWLSVYDNVYEAVDSVFRDKRIMKQAEKTERIERILRVVGLWEHRQKKPGELSGGMRQRCAVARAFAVQPRVLLLDEPFGAVDALTKSTLHDELLSLWSLDKTTETVIMVTHDIDEAIYLSDRIVVMTNGPRATIREVVEVSLGRPRDKRGMLHDPAYADVKDHLIELLTDAAGVEHAA